MASSTASSSLTSNGRVHTAAPLEETTTESTRADASVDDQETTSTMTSSPPHQKAGGAGIPSIRRSSESGSEGPETSFRDGGDRPSQRRYSDDSAGDDSASQRRGGSSVAGRRKNHRKRGAGGQQAVHIDAEEQHRQNKRVCIIRSITITVLLTATALAAFTGWYVATDEQSNFSTQFTDSVSKVSSSFQSKIDTKQGMAKTFSAMVTSRYGDVAMKSEGKGPVWPNVTIPDFQEQVEGGLSIAEGRALSFNPIIRQGE